MSYPTELLDYLQLVEYHLNTPLTGFAPGVHPGIFLGTGGRFNGFRTLLQRMEPRRIDPVATRRVGSPVPLVRVYQSRVATTVVFLADLSASMGYHEKNKEMAKLCLCLGYSAARLGDRFMAIGYANEVEWVFTARYGLDQALEAASRIWSSKLQYQNVDIFKQIIALLPRQHSIIFWASDFYFEGLSQALASLKGHDVVLLAMNHPTEYEPSFKWGWSELFDPETGKVRGIWVRPSFREKLRLYQSEWRDALIHISQQFGVGLIFTDHANPKDLIAYFVK